MKYRHIIWDWNGTLVDDAWLCVDIMNGVLHKNNLSSISLGDYKEKFVFPVKEYYARLGFDFTKTPFEVCGLDFVNAFKKRKFEASLFKESQTLLSKLKLAGLQNYLLSANHQTVLENTVDFFNLRPFFSSIHGLNHYYATSKIEEGRALLNSLGVKNREVLMVGDTLHDFEVAKNLKIDCALLSHGHNSKKRLLQTNSLVFSSLKDLAKHLSVIIN